MSVDEAPTDEVGVAVADGPSTSAPLSLDRVLVEELECLTGDAGVRVEVEGASADPGARLRAVIGLIHARHQGSAALCLSGGGIRSATFNLGVLQGLARIGLLARFDYLSSVSGGGYIASWLSSWLKRQPSGACEALGDATGDPLAPEPAPIHHLRRYSNYLTPRTGLFSADTWTALVIVLRNIFLNWLVILPLLAAAVAAPWLAASIAPDWMVRRPAMLFAIGCALGFVGLFWMNLLRADVEPPDAVKLGLRLEQRFLLAGLGPQLLAVPFMAVAAMSAPRSPRALLVFCAIWAIGTPVTALAASTLLQKPLLGRTRTYLVGDVVAAGLAGSLMAFLYLGILVHWPRLGDDGTLLAVVAPLLVLGPVLLGKALFVGFASLSEQWGRPSEYGDAEREWWARWSGWHLIAIITWTAGSAVALYGPRALDWLSGAGLDRLWAYVTAGGFTTALGWLVSTLGKSSETPGRADSPTDERAGWRGLTLQLALPLFCVVLAIVLATGVRDLVWLLSGGDPLHHDGPFPAGRVAALLVALVGTGTLMGWVVNVNRFSLQAMYRNRLMRAYLGASNDHRQPNPFTGFDPDDNIAMAELRQNRPLPIVNVACNLVGGDDLAWQQRKAASFTISPLHCGNHRLGYRRSEEYGGKRATRCGARSGGVSLGTAMATSGAAANPNMGYSSSPLLTFVMTLFNARLGIWLGNPGTAGASTFTRSAPRSSARMIFTEAFGLTDDKSPYVNLSDGGHFDNLGLYEMVLRRVRTIVVSDAGCDAGGDYDDLGNAIRKIRTDLGIPITFADRILIRSRADAKIGIYCALGSVEYAEVDGAGVRPGRLVYLKPTLCDLEPYDVYNYARASRGFPHESTVDQWFSESQFESYRVLGLTTIRTISPDTVASFDELVSVVQQYIGRHVAPAPPVAQGNGRGAVPAGGGGPCGPADVRPEAGPGDPPPAPR